MLHAVLFRKFPDFQAKMEDLIAAGGNAVRRWVQRGFPGMLEKPGYIKR